MLTGASGFVGSHILDHLCARAVPTAILLRPSSQRRSLQPHLSSIEVRAGSIADPESLRQALHDITHVVHCAGCTKALRVAEFDATNHLGTRNVVEAVNASGVQRLVHISSLAAVGPATPANPAREQDAPHPVSAYGRSKLAAELEVRNHCRAQYVILRPPAVYGPRDTAFLPLFKAVKRHILPRPDGRQAMSLVFVKDLAAAVARCLEDQAAVSRTYFVAAPEVVTARLIVEAIADQLQTWTVPLPLPASLLWPVCLCSEIASRLTGKARLLNLAKFVELRAPGWVCEPALMQRELGFACATTLKDGIAQTLKWYQSHGYL